MNLTRLSEVCPLLAKLNLQPSKTLGQNFLVDRNILNILIDAADLHDTDVVLEVGPGLGVVTQELLSSCRKVIAIERDKKLYGFLAEQLRQAANLELVCADALGIWTEKLTPRPVFNKVVSNLPYSVGSRILMHLASDRCPPERMVVTVQQEVAKRLAAQPGDSDYGIMSVWIQLAFDVQIVKVVSPNCFWPRPDVRSAVVAMRRHDRYPLSEKQKARLCELTRVAFSHRRKQLASVLGQYPGSGLSRDAWQQAFCEMGLDEKVRAERLDVNHWCRLTDIDE